ncbi:hypothetical protein U1Q18_035295 [Sarracenia purpurea var. burkii]
MELACACPAKKESKTKRLKRETMGLNSDSLLIIKLPTSQALRVMSRSLFLAMLLLALPCIGSILRGPPNSLSESEADESESPSFDFLPLLFGDLSDKGLLKNGDKGLSLSSGVGNLVDYSEFLNSEIDLAIESDLDGKNSIPDETFDFVFAFDLNSKAATTSVDRVLKIGGLLVMQLSTDPSNSFQYCSNYKIVYLRQFECTVIAMRKTGSMDHSANPRRNPQGICNSNAEAKKSALKGLEEVLLDPPPGRALSKSGDYSRKIKFLPDLSGDSLESYRQRIFITDHNEGAVQWFYQNYPMRNQYFEVYDLEIEIYDSEKASDLPASRRTPATAPPEMTALSDWLMKNVREEDFVVMKAEAQVVEEMVRKKTICLVDELFLECKSQWQRAYWECLALYGRLRDEGVAVHQWWG